MITVRKEFSNKENRILRRNYEVREGNKIVSSEINDAAKMDVVIPMRLRRSINPNIPFATEEDVAVRKFRLKRSRL